MKKKELLKIVKFSRQYDEEVANKISEMAIAMDTSSRKIIQFALAFSMNIRSIPKYPKQYSNLHERALIGTAFIPFSENLWNQCKSLLEERKMSFKQAVTHSIEKTYEIFLDKKIDKESEDYKMYIRIEF